MPRLKKELVLEREEFARDCFRRGMTIEQANKSLAEAYNGMKMALPRLAELYTEVTTAKAGKYVAAIKNNPPIETRPPTSPIKTGTQIVQEKQAFKEELILKDIERQVKPMSIVAPTVDDKFLKYAIERSLQSGKKMAIIDISSEAKAEYDAKYNKKE